MERLWRKAGWNLGEKWKLVALAGVVLTAIFALGIQQLEFATGQDSYLNPDSQEAIDNVEFQNNFGGETVILLFQATGDATVRDLFVGPNLDELRRLNEELAAVDESYAVISPLTALEFSAELLQGGAATNALISASQREDDPVAKATREDDVRLALARLQGVGDQEFDNPSWIDLLMFDNTGFVNGDDGMEAPDVPTIRKSLRGSFPNMQTAVGGVLLQGNADLDTQSAGTEKILEIMDNAELDGFEIVTTGSPVYLREINNYLKGGMLTLGAAALIVMAIVLGFMFKVRWRLLPLAVVIVGVIWGFAILGFIGVNLSLVTISGLPILIGLGIDFAIQIQNRIEEEVERERGNHPVSETLANVGPPLVVAVIAAILAFLSLQISRVPMIRDFGVMLAIGIAVLLAVGIIIPATALGRRTWIEGGKGKKPEADADKATLVERVVVALGGLPTKAAIPLIFASIGLFVAGIALEGQFKIESDPIRWIDQNSNAVKDIETLEEATGFSSTLGILVQANNVLDENIDLLIHEFTIDAEQDPGIATTSSLVNTMAKIIDIDGTPVLPPTQADIVAAASVMPPDIAKALLSPDGTATQVNLRLGPASLDERAVLVERLEADLNSRIDALDLPADSILLTDISGTDRPVRAVPAGLAVVGVGLLENLSSNRAVLTYLGLALVALWLLLRFRSVPRTLLSLVPIGLAVGASSVFVGLSGISLSPLTTVSGPLVIATCTEFSVLIMARYLEERQSGLAPRDATNQAALRTGLAFFTSALTTIGGFAVLVGSALPLLRDFGIIVTLNVAVALLSALVVMPPLMVFADERGWLPIKDRHGSVRLAADGSAREKTMAYVAVAAVVVIAGALYASADRSSGDTTEVAYAPVALPEPEVVEPEVPPTDEEAEPPTDGDPEGDPGETPETPAIDPLSFGTEAPPDSLIVGPVLIQALTAQGAAPENAACTAHVVLSRISETDLLALGLAAFTPESLAPIEQAAADCQIPQEVIDATVAAGIPS